MASWTITPATMNVRCVAFAHILLVADVSMCSDFLSKNEDAAAKAAVAADKAAEQAKSQIVAKSKMSKAEKSQQKKEKVRMQVQHHFYRLSSLIPRDFARRPRHSIPLQPQKRRSDALINTRLKWRQVCVVKSVTYRAQRGTEMCITTASLVALQHPAVAST